MESSLFGVLWALVGAIFSAGIFYARSLQTRRDINGIGAKARNIEDKATDRFIAMSFALLLVAPEEKRNEIANILLNAALRR